MIVMFLVSITTLKAQTCASSIHKETYAFRDTFKLDVYWDPSIKVSGKRPVFLQIHGGGWGGGWSKQAWWWLPWTILLELP